MTLFKDGKSNASIAYQQKLRDPRWAKLRETILARDEYICQSCKADNLPLEVHHRYYLPDRDPWDYDDDALVSLCRECHAEEGFYEECLAYEREKKRREIAITHPRIKADLEMLFGNLRNTGSDESAL